MYTYPNRFRSRGRICVHADMSIRLEGQDRQGFQFLVDVFSIPSITRCSPVFVETAAGSRHSLVEAAVIGFTRISAFSSLAVSEAPIAEWAEGGGFKSTGIF